MTETLLKVAFLPLEKRNLYNHYLTKEVIPQPQLQTNETFAMF